MLKAISLAALAAAIIAAIFVFTMSAQRAPGSADVKFTEFVPERTEIRVGELSNVVFNVQNKESRPINDSSVHVVIDLRATHRIYP
jgi:hypothetical protein